MTTQQEALAAIRFGTGLRPSDQPPSGPDALMASLDGKPLQLDIGTPAPLSRRMELRVERQELFNIRRKERAAGKDLTEIDARQKAQRMPIIALLAKDLTRQLERAVRAPVGFSERLARFWSDHFSVALPRPWDMTLTIDMIETAIRPHVSGRFPDMLRAVSTHPAMLVYLNQVGSVGPNSRAGTNRNRGLNENLAREILELHTLGVSGTYTQDDVRQFAELLTGLTMDKDGFRFRPPMAEPGAETVLGVSYGGRKASLNDIEAALDDLALHPQTAQHLATKLCRHFIGGTLDPTQVAAMTDAYLAADGDMRPMLAAMLEHPAAWTPTLEKAKTPFDFITSSLRALGDNAPQIGQMDGRIVRRDYLRPMEDMGQLMYQPNAPDGWPEEPETWITPAGLTARLIWIGKITQQNAQEIDPRTFIETALGPLASDILRRATAGAETRSDGVALVLASPEFNRR